MTSLTTLAIKLGTALKQHNLSLVLAESCTGGMIAEAVTSVAGSSAWFDRGFITYSNQAKIEMLSVQPETLEKFGAVSEEVAREMALGCLNGFALNNNHARIAASITGIAGPDGGSAQKPVGTVCFSWIILKQPTENQHSRIEPINVMTKYFTGSRQQIRQQATAFLMQQLIDDLNKTN